MPHISQRISNIQPSMTVAIDTRAKEMVAEGRDIIGLGAGEPDFPTPPTICEAAMESIRAGRTRYTAPAGLPELRKAVANKLARENSLSYTPQQVVITSGAKQAVAHAIAAVVDPGDEVIVPAPYWVTYPELVRLSGGIPVKVQTEAASGWRMTPTQLDAAISPRTSMLILCNPGNPTGMVYTKQELSEFAEILVRHDVLCLSDEVYEHIQYDGRRPFSIAAHSAAMQERTIVVNGLSKAYAMTGWRVGWLAAEPGMARAVAALQSQASHHPANASQYGAVAAYAMGLDFVHGMTTAFQERRDLVVEVLRAIPGIEVPEPQGAFYALPDVSAFLGRSTPDGRILSTSLELSEWLLDAHGVAVVPGAAFGHEPCVRLSFATSTSVLREALRRLHAGFTSLN